MGKHVPSGVRFILLAMISAGYAHHGPAQEPASDFFDNIEVNVVNVEVFVTDKKGNPVTDLTADDFEIFEDGKPAAITNFYAARSAAAADIKEGSVTEDIVPENAASQAQPPEEYSNFLDQKPQDQRLNLVIFIDNLNISPDSRNRVLEALRGSLFYNLGPNTRVLVVSYDGSLNFRSGFTSNPEELVPILEELTTGSPRGVHGSLDRLAILRQLKQIDYEEDLQTLDQGFASNAGADPEPFISTIRTYAQQRHGEVAKTVQVLSRFVDSLAGLPGRKALIYASDGLELRPGEALFYAFDNKYRGTDNSSRGFINVEREIKDFDATPLLEELGRHANDNQVTFYTVLARGGRAHTISPAEESALIDVNAAASTVGRIWDQRIEAIEASGYRGSMQILADATGGVATTDTSAIGNALKRLKQDFDHYYSLGYESPHQGDGKSHRIKVKLKDKSLRVRHRESYRDKSSEERMSERTLSALVFDVHENPLGVVVEVGQEELEKAKNQYRVPIMVKFPIAKVLLLPQEHFHEGRVSIFVGARDRKGGSSPIQRIPAPIRVPNEQLVTVLGQVAGFRAVLTMRPGEHSVVVGVRDELANVESTTSISHTPGGAEIKGGA